MFRFGCSREKFLWRVAIVVLAACFLLPGPSTVWTAAIQEDIDVERPQGQEDEAQRERQRQEAERQAETERHRQAEAEKQRQAEAEHQRQAEAERQRQAEAEHQRQAEAERQRQAERLAREIAAARPDMVYVEGGAFTMGDTFDEGHIIEKPARRVTVGSFYIGKYEVIFSEYDAFCQSVGRQKPDDRGWGRGNRPVINVSWFDAVAYCNWRSGIDGLRPAYVVNGMNVACDFTANGYRLPTEAEWEYAAKGGKIGRGYKHSGSDDPDAVAWHSNNSSGITHPVGQKRPNELGLYDMNGNVLEWCWDWFDTYAEAGTKNPSGPAAGSCRVIRGGGYDNYGRWYLHTSSRYNYPPGVISPDQGFRLVRSL